MSSFKLKYLTSSSACNSPESSDNCNVPELQYDQIEDAPLASMCHAFVTYSSSLRVTRFRKTAKQRDCKSMFKEQTR